MEDEALSHAGTNCPELITLNVYGCKVIRSYTQVLQFDWSHCPTARFDCTFCNGSHVIADLNGHFHFLLRI